jgi:glucose/arabinose dehydrogenase
MMNSASVRGALAAWLLSSLTAPAFAQRDLKEIPDPNPELERATFVVPEGFEVNLFAGGPADRQADPDELRRPGAAVDRQQRGLPADLPGKPANDKILMLEDVNGDGSRTRPRSSRMACSSRPASRSGDGGAYVGASTELLHLTDTDGDGKSDDKRIVLSGFGTEDTHHIIHTLRWGPEGFLYMNQSIYIHSHVETPWGVKRLNAGGHWQFRPETLQLEVLDRGLVNSWGLAFDNFGPRSRPTERAVKGSTTSSLEHPT